MSTLPTLYIPHGGGPWPWVESMASMHGSMRSYFESLGSHYEGARAILLISAHWEEADATVLSAPRPAMLYDYYGFPDHTYSLTWPAPGDPDLAHRVVDLLRSSGIRAGTDGRRGFDHGCFVPLKLAYPDANIPTIQLSLLRGLDPARHYALGRALEPLRAEGVFIVGSGMSYHNMRGFDLSGPRETANADSELFDAWLSEAVSQTGSARDAALSAWAQAPAARASHPREEHLLPLHVVAGAAPNASGHVVYRDVVLGTRVSAFEFRD